MAVVTTVYDSTCKVCDVVRYQLYKAFIYVQRSRQLSANEKIFQDIKGFDREAGYHLANMNDATNKKYDNKLKNFRSNLSAWGWEDPIDD
tara:strand:- start:9551 stop:9820 length:270 start_codon:yes stop_codon:yes gene_type:complete